MKPQQQPRNRRAAKSPGLPARIVYRLRSEYYVPTKLKVMVVALPQAMAVPEP